MIIVKSDDEEVSFDLLQIRFINIRKKKKRNTAVFGKTITTLWRLERMPKADCKTYMVIARQDA